MIASPRKLEMPLLSKELLEQAMRPRTYVLRMAYAFVLFTLFAFSLYATFAAGGGVDLSGVDALEAHEQVIGRGEAMFDWVLAAQLIGVFVFLPAMMADAITRERERNALDLLLLTQLRPWDILAQKLLSRLIPMGSILMLTTPLLGVAYSYGGVEAGELWTGVWAVTLTCLQVGAICLLLSVDAPKTSSALLSAYIRLPIAMIGLLILGAAVGGPWRALIAAAFPGVAAAPWTACFVPATLMGVPDVPPLGAILFTLPAAASVLWYLNRSINRLLLLMESNPGERPTPAFELAAVPQRRRNRVHEELPGDRPIAWMDRTSHLMVQLNKVFLVAITIDLPIFLWLAANVVTDEEGGQRPGLAVLTAATWLVAAPIVAMIAAGAFAAERTGQTLEVLLTTPIRTHELVRQKAAASRRFALMMCVPLGAAVLTQWLLEGHAFGRLGLLYLGGALLCIGVYLPLAMWTGIWIGMRVRDRGRAVVLVLAVFAALVVVVPMMVGAAEGALGPSSAVRALGVLSPATVLWMNETGWRDVPAGERWLWLAANFTLWGGALWAVRRRCLYGADVMLGRIAAPRSLPAGAHA